ncbi:hypothetical protein [Terrihabitans sp. B22-R8]|uniref:hypothetical protein n=1 Tax=Terrihabitans sp. B22-R8 TaxID=3425128 RepID=UPI00403C344F
MLALAVGEPGQENRFFGCEITAKAFRAYKNGRIDLNFVFKHSTGRRHYVMNWSEMDDNHQLSIKKASEKEVLDLANYPDRGFFEEDHTEEWLTATAPSATKRFNIDGRWEANDFSRFYNKIGDIYSFLSIVEDLESPDIGVDERRAIMAALTSPTWRGGGSYTGFYAEIANRAQEIRPLRVSGIAYHSPGHIDVQGRATVFDEINQVSRAFTLEYDKIKKLYSGLASILTRDGMRSSDKDRKFSSEAIKNQALKVAFDLALAMKVNHTAELLAACGGNAAIFAKVILSYYRRLRDLHDFQQQGRLTIVE